MTSLIGELFPDPGLFVKITGLPGLVFFILE